MQNQNFLFILEFCALNSLVKVLFKKFYSVYLNIILLILNLTRLYLFSFKPCNKMYQMSNTTILVHANLKHIRNKEQLIL